MFDNAMLTTSPCPNGQGKRPVSFAPDVSESSNYRSGVVEVTGMPDLRGPAVTSSLPRAFGDSASP